MSAPRSGNASRSELSRQIGRHVPELERRAFERFARRNRWGVNLTRILPIMLCISITLWTFAPLATMRTLTPYVGASALLCAGVYLFRVLARIGHFSNKHLADLPESSRPALLRLKRSLYQMASVLIGVLCMAGGYFYLSTTVLAETERASETGLLWSLPMGGLVMSIFFGEAVTRLIEVVEEAMEHIEANAIATPESDED